MEGSSMKNGLNVDKYGNKYWYLNDKRHREDGPAIEWINGAKYWYLNGQLHREGGPAVEEADGSKKWYLNGQLHREGGPAVEYVNGSKYWYLNGQLHREGGPAVEEADGTKKWYLNDKHLKIIPQYVLINYMKANNFTLAHLLTDPDPLVRESVGKHKWKEVV
jgi:hypothetical protein